MVRSTKKVRFSTQTRDNAPWESSPGRFFVCYQDEQLRSFNWVNSLDMQNAINAARKRYDQGARRNATLSVIREGGGEYFFGQYE